jgi:antitoxin component YwqK of YwqJK toxin-antitoxin module
VNGQLSWKGNYKNSQYEGFWVSYEENGTVQKRLTGTFKDGKKISD